MLEPKLRDRAADIVRLVRIERAGQARLHVAEGAGARAGVAHDHHGGVAMRPALADIRARRFLADGVQLVLAHDLPRRGIFAADGRLDPDPVRLAQDGTVGPVRLFRMARRGAVDNDGHRAHIYTGLAKITSFR